MSKEIDVALLRLILRYDPSTGVLTWLPRTPDLFETSKWTAEHSCKVWNSKYAGKEAFTYVSNGYKTGSLFAVLYLAHRVVWAMSTGAWPVEEVDHINGRRDDNRIVNLRAVSRQENMQNQKMRSTNTSGVMGVTWKSHCSRWAARIVISDKDIHLGYFHTLEEAAAARKAAERKFGFHENHGRPHIERATTGATP